MKKLILLILFFAQLNLAGFCMMTATNEKKDSIRGNINGYFFFNEDFCDKLEEFIDVMDSKGFVSKDYPIILISATQSKDADNIYVITVNLRDEKMFSEIVPNSNYIYMDGGRIKGRYIVVKEESVVGRFLHSEFNIHSIAKELDSIAAERITTKYSERKPANVSVVRAPYMKLDVDTKGNVSNVSYHKYDASYKTKDIIEFKNNLK